MGDAVERVKAEQAAMAPLWAVRHAQDGQKTALQVIQEARNAGGEAARIIAQEEAALDQLQTQIQRVQGYREHAVVAQLRGQLGQYDRTDTSTRLWKALHAHSDVIRRTIEAAERLLAASKDEETTAAALTPRDAAEDLAGWVPAEERLFAHQLARDEADEALREVGYTIIGMPVVDDAPGLEMPTVRSLLDREELPGWGQVFVNVEADLGPRGFPGEGAPAVVPGLATENHAYRSASGQQVRAHVPVGEALFIAPAPIISADAPVQAAVGDWPEFVRVEADGPGRQWHRVTYAESLAVAGGPGDSVPAWIEGDLKAELENVQARIGQLRHRSLALSTGIQERQQRLEQLRSRPQGAVKAGAVAALEAELAVYQTADQMVNSAMNAQANQVRQLEEENRARQRGGELARVIQVLQSQGDDPSDQGLSLWKALDEHQHGVPVRMRDASTRRQAWRAVEEAAAALTLEVLTDAATLPQPIQALPDGDPAGWAAHERHARATALVDAYLDAASHARMVTPPSTLP